VLLDFESVTDIDPTASEALADSVATLHENGKVAGITRASAPVRGLLRRYGISETIGPDHIYPSNRAALNAYLQGCRAAERPPADLS
jgi:MFS superfamily sulfate permease-like transporter